MQLTEEIILSLCLGAKEAFYLYPNNLWALRCEVRYLHRRVLVSGLRLEGSGEGPDPRQKVARVQGSRVGAKLDKTVHDMEQGQSSS